MPARGQSLVVAALGCLTAIVLLLGALPDASAGGYYSGRPYGYSYPDDRFGLSRDIARLREQLRQQQLQLREQIRLQDQQIRLLRAQASAQHQVTAMQACYYRLSAGIETCEDLFAVGSMELQSCTDKVTERNAGCARNVARPESSGGG